MIWWLNPARLCLPEKFVFPSERQFLHGDERPIDHERARGMFERVKLRDFSFRQLCERVVDKMFDSGTVD